MVLFRNLSNTRFDEVDVVKKKIKTHRFDCTIQSSSRLGYLSREVKLKYRESEIAMTLDDHQQQATKESMNDLESYIYHMRDKLQGVLCDFASSTEKEVLGSKLIEAENWVYNNPEGTVDVYTSKLNELKVRECLCSA